MFLSIVLDKTDKYIISVSGGIDSMVLLDFLYHKKYRLIVVHFNHSIRQEAIKDKILVKNYCKKKKINFHYFKLNFNNNEKNFQNKARILRLEKLKEIALKYKTKYLITAHHLDDLSETIFLKILRGSSLLGYSGMQTLCYYDNFILLKPFLYLEKKKIIEYAKKNKIMFLEDKTNKQNIYTRNKIRNQVIPFFQESHNFLQNIKKFHFQISEIHHFIRKQTFLFLEKQNIYNFFDLKSFLNLDIIIQKDIILFLLENKKIYKNFVLINNIIKSLNNKKKPFIVFNLNSQYELVKKYDFFSIVLKSSLNESNTQSLKFILYLHKEKIFISFCSIIQKIYYDDDNFFPPFIIRQRQKGDILKFHFGTQKLSKFFINKKVLLSKRNKILIISDQKNNIIWIPDFYINKTLGKNNFVYLGLKEV
ncbi:tRNA lysidine(34) synthetase TilS [Candidatus Phytoplasma oryzae]|nr:tRNA lysidine(34) synthetase TilS [Candidatus Phytoplasma oryzae]